MGKEDPMSMRPSSRPSKKASSTPNYDRRREQVRRAQKKHREQKEKSCRVLEDELHKLYDLFTNAQELRNLHCENEILKDIISRHSIPLPASVLSRKFPLARVTMIGEEGPSQYLQVQMPDDIHSSYSQARQDLMPSNETGTSQYSQIHSDEIYQNVETWSDETRSVECGGHVCESDIRHLYSANNEGFAQLGVDFVLSLERPCLFHTQPLGSQEPSGHAMSMQGLLLSGAPSEPKSRSSWEVPAQQLNKLFELSGSLGLDGYITPVQAWNRICRRFSIGELPTGSLDRLRSAMVPYIHCIGFGARMDEQIFEDLLHKILQGS